MLKLRHLFILSALCLLPFADRGMGQTLTLVRDNVQNPDGTGFSGTLTLTWVGGAGGPVTPTSTSASVISGLFSVLLQPTTTVSPCAYYSATFTSSSGATSFTQQWFVPPSSLPQAIADVSTPNSACANLGGNPPPNGFSAGLSVQSSYAFAAQNIGTTSAAYGIVATSTGTLVASFTGASIAGTNAGDFAISSNTCTGTLSQNHTCTIGVTFTPSAAGTRSAQLQIADNVSGSPQIVQLSGTGQFAGITATSSLTFASQTVGSTSTAQTVTLQNPTSTSYSLTNVALTGTNSADFTIAANACGTTLAANSSCTISVTFTPSNPGTRTASLQITSTAPNSPSSVSITGTGLGSSLTVTSSLTFAAQGMSTSSAPQVVSFQNAGGAPITFYTLPLGGNNPGDFTISGNTCPPTLAGGASCQLNVTFSPQAVGTRTASIQITDNATNSPQNVSLTGTGATTTLTVPSSLTFSSQTVSTTSAAQQVNVQNGGSVTAVLNNFSITGSNAGDFAISANTCGATLAASASCVVSLTFSPSATGTRSASLQITDSASNSPQTVLLSGTATPASLTITSSIAFATQGVGTTSSGQLATVQNAGPLAISLSGISLGGANPSDFAISTTTCGSSLASGSSCQIVVTFTPLAAATYTANLQVGNSGTPNPAITSLSGTGAAVSLAVTSQLNFSQQPIFSTSAPQSVTVQNTGAVSAGFSSFTLTGTNAGDFAISTNNCGSLLLGSASCQVRLTFSPQGVGSRTGALQIIDTATNSPQLVTLTGSGLGAALTVTPSLGFATVALGANSTQAVTVQNTGGLAVTLSGNSIAGPNAGDFSVSSTTCPGSLAIGASCQINITFAPVGTEGRSATLQIANTTSVNPSTVALSGNGSVVLPLQISQVSGLTSALAQKPNMSTTYNSSSAAWIDSSGNIGSVSGNATDCVHVNGSSGPCGSGGGTTVSATFVDGETPAGVINGINPTFNLAQAPNPVTSLEVFRNGVLQAAPIDYTLSGSTITFTNIPMTSDELIAYYRVAGSAQTVHFSDAEVPAGSINSINNVFTLANTPAGGLRVYKNGILLAAGVDYTATGASITFTNSATPNTGDEVLAYYRY